MAAIGFLLVSGLVNYVLTSRQFALPTYYHLLFGVKFGLGLVVFYIASLLVGRSALADKVRARTVFWLTLNLVLATAVVCLGGVMRFTERVPKAVRLITAGRQHLGDLGRTDKSTGTAGSSSIFEKRWRSWPI